ncbi:ACP S-malonyltransferase [bacterium]|nr:ACP S-malonyltransferase [bacterium]
MSAHRLAALFPGQGAQYPGMIKELLGEFPSSKQLFEEASDALGVNLTKLCLEGPEDQLQLTMNAQPAILTTSFAWFQTLRQVVDFQPQAGAGHSLGEYSALLASGAMGLPEAVRLVRERGRLMQNAVPAGKGKMAALLGLEDEAARELCRLATQGETSLVVPANFNSPGQVVIAGHAEAVDRASVLAGGEAHPHLKARKVIPLKVSAPFHCPLMKPVAEAFEASLRSVAWKPRRFGIVHNLDAAFRQEGDLVPLLRDQIDHPVLWTQCQKALEDQGTAHYFEMGPGRVLTGLGKRNAKGTFHNIESAADVKAAEKLFQETLR